MRLGTGVFDGGPRGGEIKKLGLGFDVVNLRCLLDIEVKVLNR